MLTGKIAVVTGASRGIGKEIAKTLAAKGATVVVNYNGSAEKAEETVKEIEALGGKAEALQCNVSDYDKAAEMMTYVVKTYGRVDILVNNAGITRDNLLMKMSEEDFDAVLNTNLKGAFNCIKHISRQMLKQKSGHIVNISSVSGVMGNARTGKLQCFQGRCDRHDQGSGKRDGKPRHHLQCSGPGIYQDRYDRGAV